MEFLKAPCSCSYEVAPFAKGLLIFRKAAFHLIDIFFSNIARRSGPSPMELLKMKIVLLSVVIIALSFSTLLAGEDVVVESSMYNEEGFTREHDKFSPYDTIYFVLDFSSMKPGQYVLTTDWQTPFGNIEHQSVYSFTLNQFTPSYRLFSWLHLWRNGPLRRTLTGDDFKKDFYGLWTVSAYLDGMLVAHRSFEIL